MKQIIEMALAEDCPWGDVTSELLVPVDAEMSADFVARQPGVMSGGQVVTEVFNQVDPSCRVAITKTDGDNFVAGESLAYVAGSARSILRAERVALNFLQHLCGVATATSVYVGAVAGTSARIIDTRKTTPGLRLLEKQAVIDGGGHNHRFALSDAVLVKDNHLAAVGGIADVGNLRPRLSHVTTIEIEVDSLDQIAGALEAGAHSILCDNFSLDDLRTAVKMINGHALVNSSGGVTLETVSEIAKTGVDLISVGAITHSVKAIDIGLDYSAQS